MLVSRVESVREDYLAAFESHVAGLRDLARGYGWVYHQHRTDRGPELPQMTLWLALAEGPGR